MDPDGKSVYLVASKGATSYIPESIAQLARVEELDRSYMQPLQKHQPYRPEMYKDGIENLGPLPVFETIKNGFIKVPLLSQNKLVGTLTIINDQDSEEWFEAEKQWLGVIGCQIGVFIDQMDVFENFKDRSILQERERLSQELHDNLSQTVGAIRMLSEQMASNLKKHNISRLEQDVEYLEAIAREAYANVREEMIGLRFVQYPDAEIVLQIQGFVERFSKQWAIETTFEVVGSEKSPLIPPAKGIQLFRIIQEALSNVRRHSQATNASVTLEAKDNIIQGRIQDNGQGFEISKIAENKLGLKIMRERANDVGGTLWVESEPGTGTTVYVDIPISDVSWE
jgi:signal transduction histidine kinase